MRKEITLIKNNENRKRDDLDWIEEFYNFLQGDIPDGITMRRGHKPKMSEKKAMAIVWFLQEKLTVFPDHVERCDNCGGLFDSDCGGLYWETKGRHYCGGCEYLVPENYDRGKR